MAKPSTLPEWASSPTSGDIVEPSAPKKAAGWAKVSGTPEKPLYQYFNWYQNLVYLWTTWFDSNIDQGVKTSDTPSFNGLKLTNSPKTTPLDADTLGLMDSANGNTMKPITVANLALKILSGATPIAAQIVASTAKTVPADADLFALVDSADANTLKQLSFVNLAAKVATYSGSAYINSNITVSASKNIVDTSSGVLTITLPPSPTLGKSFEFSDIALTFDTNNLTIARNGKNIMGNASDLICDIRGISFTIWYNGTEWRLQ